MDNLSELREALLSDEESKGDQRGKDDTTSSLNDTPAEFKLLKRDQNNKLKINTITMLLFVKMKQTLDEETECKQSVHYYGFRCHLKQTLLDNVIKKIDQIEDFLYWYVVGNSINEFTEFLEQLEQKHGDTFSRNLNSFCLMYGTLNAEIENYFDSKFIKADVNVLRKKFKIGTYETIVIDKPKSDILKDVYDYVKTYRRRYSEGLCEKKQQLEQENEIVCIPNEKGDSDDDQNRPPMPFDPHSKIIKTDHIETLLFVKIKPTLDKETGKYRLPVIRVLCCQLNSLVTGVFDIEQEIEDFLYWHVVRNSVKDFNSYRNFLEQYGVNVTYANRLSVTYGDIDLNFEPSNKNIVTHAQVYTTISTFFNKPHTIRADVNVLRRLFECGNHEAIVIDAPRSHILRDVYDYVEESYHSAFI